MGSFLAFSATLVSAGLTGLAAYEAYALASGRVPAITQIVRAGISRHPHYAVSIGAMAGVLVGWLIGHLGKY